jgi:hypothetical protein
MDEGQPTQFNMAIATLQRMDKVLTVIGIYAVQLDFVNWYRHLTELRRNVAPFIKAEEYSEISNLLGSLSDMHWLKKDNKVKKMFKDEVYQILDEATIKLHRAMKDAGILMPKSDDPRQAIRG